MFSGGLYARPLCKGPVLFCYANALTPQVRGPPAKASFGADGSPTKALEGFCKKNGVALADVTKQTDSNGVEYVYAQVKEEGRSAAEVSAS